MAVNLFEELKSTLQEFKDFLDQKVAVIKPAITALKAMFPDQIGALLSKLIELMTTLKTEVQNIDVSAVPGLAEVSNFATKVKSLVTASRALLPDAASEFDAVSAAADVIGGLPSVDALKAEIIALIDAILAHLNSLNS